MYRISLVQAVVLWSVLLIAGWQAAKADDSRVARLIVSEVENEQHRVGLEELANALKRNKYGVESKSLDTQPMSTQDVKRELQTTALNTRHAESAIVYLQGRGKFGEKGLVLPIAPNVDVEFADLLAAFERIPQDKRPKSVLILLDILSTADQPVIQHWLEQRLADRAFPISVISSVRASGSSGLADSPLLAHLTGVLTFDRRADQDADRSLSWKELIGHLQRQAPASSIFTYPSTPPLGGEAIVKYVPRDLETMCLDSVAEASVLIERHNVQRLVLLPLMIRDQGVPAQGNLPSYIADRVRRHLVSRTQITHIPRPDSVIDSLKAARIGPHELSTRLSDVANAVRAGRTPEHETQRGKEALLFSSFEYVHEAEATLGLRLRMAVFEHGKLVDSIELNPITAALSAGERAMATPVEQFAMARLDGLNDDRLDSHPMISDAFYPRVYLEVNGNRVAHEFLNNGTRMVVDVQAGDDYVIVIDNRGGQDLFLRLLVDGKSTLPDHPYGGAGRREPGVPVSLTRARCWFCGAGKTYRIRGFFDELDPDRPNAIAYKFAVVDAPIGQTVDDWPSQAMGVITAAFFRPIPQKNSAMAYQPQFATKLGDDEDVPISFYDGNCVPGDLHGVVNVEYGF